MNECIFCIFRFLWSLPDCQLLHRNESVLKAKALVYFLVLVLAYELAKNNTVILCAGGGGSQKWHINCGYFSPILNHAGQRQQ